MGSEQPKFAAGDDSLRTLLLSYLSFWLQAIGAVCFVLGLISLPTEYEGSREESEAASLHELYGRYAVLSNNNLSSSWTEPLAGRVVFVVIDALRADFVFTHDELSHSGFQDPVSRNDGEMPVIGYLRSLLEESVASPYLARVRVPTVTMPRVKAITTGSIPGMADLINNFDAKEMSSDSLIDIWKREGRKLTMFGDDTWLKLFPSHFLRSDGTHSFFVHDFVEVDSNVTRHLKEEMQRDDWDVCVLHYLGLDHIGHVLGPKSRFIPGKLREMGDVIKLIKDSLFEETKWKNNRPPAIVVLGDHGMANEGGHGGGSFFEAFTPVVMISPQKRASGKLHHPTLIEQHDLAPTLSLLTGVRIPCNNVGMVIQDALRLFSSDDFVDFAKFCNAEQMAGNLVRRLGEAAANDHDGYNRFMNAKVKRQEVDNLDFETPCRTMAETLDEASDSFNIVWAIAGLSIVAAAPLSVLERCHRLIGWEFGGGLELEVLLLHVMRVVSFTSTSFIEEEHQSVYFTGMTLLCLLFVRWHAVTSRKPVVLAMLVLGICRRWNRTGDKWSSLPDVTDYLDEPESKSILTLVHVASLIGITFMRLASCCRRLPMPKINKVIFLTAMMFVFVQKASDGHVYPVALFSPNVRALAFSRTVYALFFVGLISGIQASRVISLDFSICCEIFLDAILPVLALLARSSNTFILFGALVVENLIHQTIGHGAILLITQAYHIFGLFTYFCLGNSNKLTTLDLGAAYIGLADYHFVVVPFLMAINTLSGPLLWFALLFSRVRDRDQVSKGLLLLSIFRWSGLLLVLVVTIVCRHHLFAWTVFAPKALYEVVISLFFLCLSSHVTFFHLGSWCASRCTQNI